MTKYVLSSFLSTFLYGVSLSHCEGNVQNSHY